MIHYLTSRANACLMAAFLDGWGRALKGRVAILTYEDLLGARSTRLGPGTYIFTSIGRALGSREPLSPVREWVVRLHAALTAEFGPERVLNDPLRSMRRLELLQALHREGINRFRGCRVAEASSLRLPVFLRAEQGTVWTPPEVIRSPEVLAQRVAAGEAPGRIAIEHCDTADADGVYRKYGAFVVGGRIVPRHLFFSRQWLVKSADLVDKAKVGEELAYLESNPHAGVLARVCEIARIGWGRIDYAIDAGGVLQIWEINTTPQLATPPQQDAPERRCVHERFAQMLGEAFDALEPG